MDMHNWEIVCAVACSRLNALTMLPSSKVINGLSISVVLKKR